MYQNIFVAGTFDGLHAGHRHLLSKAFRVGEKVTVGLTSDGFVIKFKSQISNPESQTLLRQGFGGQANPKFKIQKKIQHYEKRIHRLKRWLHEQGFLDRATIIPIDDPYEPAASMPDLDAIIVTRENRKTGEHINVLRQGSTLPPLALIEVPMVSTKDGKPISSTRLRNGEMDGDGRIIMPESMRAVLGEPLGDVLTGDAIARSIRQNSGKVIITVGDVATKTVLDAGITPTLAIIDGKVGRKPFHETLNILQLQKVKPFRFKAVKSGPGFISREAVNAIKNCFSHTPYPRPHTTILIDGEEDLLVLPAILHAHVGGIVYYGQPGEGLVEVFVTKQIQNKVRSLLEDFIG